jgi:MOSC domain-containing protein YiiM
MPEIRSIVYTPTYITEKSQDRYDRLPLSQAKLVAGYGIEGDRKGGHPKRHLNIMCAETLGSLGAEGFSVAPGEMGEQLILSGIDLIDLPPGARVRLGDAAEIEVVEPRNGCDKFERVQGKAPTQAKRRLGVMARVLASGVIAVGDPVVVMREQATEA